MSSNPTYTIDIQPAGNHLRVEIKELGITVETEPGQVKQEDAERVALAAISRYHTKFHGSGSL
jgi:hypothetical protein